MTISDILRHKSDTRAASGAEADPASEVVTISPGATIAELAAALAEHRIGAVVVVDGGAVAGIVSERDIVRDLAGSGADALARPVSAIMTVDVVSCTNDDAVEDVAATMTQRRIRHMPVLDGARLVGIVSIGDVVSSRIRQLEHDRGQLEQYIAG
jgi:CBS domain-containing protein